jgi:hypothetical protein
MTPLRQWEFCRNPSVRVRDQDQNKMAVVNAVKALEQMKDDDTAGGMGQPIAPGFIIVIASTDTAKPPIVDVTPAERAPALRGQDD